MKYDVQRQFFLSMPRSDTFPVSLRAGKPHIYITLFPIAGAHRDVGSNPAQDNFCNTVISLNRCIFKVKMYKCTLFDIIDMKN